MKKNILLLYVILAFSVAACASNPNSSQPTELSNAENPKDDFMGIRLQGTLKLGLDSLSGLSWDEDEQLLYAISDTGMLHHLSLEYSDGKLVGSKLLHSVKITANNGEVFRRKSATDSEGLDALNSNNGIKGDTELLISFEHNSRIDRYTPRGEYLGNITLPAKLQNAQNYAHPNKTLESLAHHPVYGLLTAAEKPLKGHDSSTQTIYGVNNSQEWHFQAESDKNSYITAIAPLGNNLLILERAWAGLTKPLVITLKQLHTDQCDRNQHCNTSMIAKFSTAKGWIIDNYEGLAPLGNNQYLMVSDNNGSPIQRTLLTQFTVKTEQ